MVLVVMASAIWLPVASCRGRTCRAAITLLQTCSLDATPTCRAMPWLGVMKPLSCEI
ncbi:hypothetical protein PR003_g23089 [Phytophthora rubi]|uniref:RxLR effector protein n=1 Tax=Phytophthora rubi TaxID=129364 RepID=A0A6A3J7S1_9STRA|nr:hypothetical protein PR002_g21951 [Phytophthora rubi]KAE8988234.1 hypothetical protein PR001_g22097 [Phytophthora rubi]KAE9299071.1 hypothetical protein PR003_g23089 [Phytophthora rubi]